MTSQERRRHARALWRKACATMECNDGNPKCAFWRAGPMSSLTVSGMSVTEWTVRQVHRWEASALLDGLACEDLP